MKDKVRKRKGRGFGGDAVQREPIDYESVQDDENELEPGPQRCKTLHLFSLNSLYTTEKLFFNVKSSTILTIT